MATFVAANGAAQPCNDEVSLNERMIDLYHQIVKGCFEVIQYKYQCGAVKQTVGTDSGIGTQF